MVTPFGFTPAWMAHYLKLLHEGVADCEARIAANRLFGVAGKKFAKALLAGDVTLSVPLVGGASVMKRRDAWPLISSHGKWRREHLGAWLTAYGRTPFFIHLMPEIEMVYQSAADDSALEDFNSALLRVALGWLSDYDEATAEKVKLQSWIAKFNIISQSSLSIFDSLFRYGKDTLFAII